MTLLWLVILLAVASVGAFLWRRRFAERNSDLGVVSDRWLMEKRSDRTDSTR
jgi:hypothetical protein